MASVDEKPYVAVVACPGLGHVIPFLELSKRLIIHHGCHVSFLEVTTTTKPSLAQHQLLQSPQLIPQELHVVRLPPVHVADIVSDVDDTSLVTQISLIAKESLTKSLKAALNPPPKAVIIDMFCTEAFEICKEISVPVYLFFTSPAALLAFSFYLPELGRAVEAGRELVDLPETIAVPGFRQLAVQDLLDQFKNWKDDDYKWFLLHADRWQKGAAGIFINTWQDLEPVSLSALGENQYFLQLPTPPVHAIGPLIRQVEAPSSAAGCLTWLEKQPPESVLYVCLGSGGTLTTEQLTELAWGLELSRKRFVWIVHAPTDLTASGKYFCAGDDDDDEVNPSTYLPEGFMERTSGIGVVVASWAPQTAILQHPSTGAFLSHCGWNSILESICNGVPMIAWPLFGEQSMNAAMVEDLGVAVWPAKAEVVVVKREVVMTTVIAVMEGEEGVGLRQKARDLKDSAAKALFTCGGSSMEALCKEWK